MKKLSETLTELGIAFSFPIIIKDANGNSTYREYNNGFCVKREFDAYGNKTYYENSDGLSFVHLPVQPLTNNTPMKPISETYKELGIAFKFPIEINDANGKRTYYENSEGWWERIERDAKGNKTYYETSNRYWEKYEYNADGIDGWTYYENSRGLKEGTPRSAKTCEGKVVEVDGIKYKLTAL